MTPDQCEKVKDSCRSVADIVRRFGTWYPWDIVPRVPCRRAIGNIGSGTALGLKPSSMSAVTITVLK